MLDEFVSTNEDESDDPLMKASRLTQEDWCIMEWKEEEQAYCLTAGVKIEGVGVYLKTNSSCRT